MPVLLPVFAFATLLPAVLILAGCALGGAWPWWALAAITALTWLLDRLFGAGSDEANPAGGMAADALSVLLALVHVLLLPASVAALCGDGLDVGRKLALFLAAGLWMGQVSNSNAHELIHRTDRRLFNLGRLVYVTLLFGHHSSAHRLVHHVKVATPGDPNSARLGETFYAFALRAWTGSFRKGWRAETARRGKWRNPYWLYLGGAAACLALAGALAGWRGVLAWAGLAGMAQAQLLLSDYVQHYGLSRRILADGQPEPAGPAHSWNAPHWYSAHMMLNAPRHSDHHAHPARPYPALRLAPEGAELMLPRSLPVMAMIALLPPLWFRTMNRRARAAQGRPAAA